MKVKQLFLIGMVGSLMALVIVAAVAAQNSGARPYPEGQGGGAGSLMLQGGGAERPYAEGQGASAQGARIDERALEAARYEGQYGAAGSAVLGVGESIRAETLAPPGFSALYRFTGVTDDGEQSSIDRKEATSVLCTNLAADSNEVFVEIYQWNGAVVYTGTNVLETGQTATFSTQGTSVYFEDVIIGGAPGTDEINQGHGVISAENSQVICTAQALDPLNNPPTFLNELPLYRN